MRERPSMRAVARAAAHVLETRDLAGPMVRPAVIKLSLMATGIGVLTAAALCSVPFYPVPLTMQTLAVLLVGGLLGPRLGVAAVGGYIVLGLTGAPVFHGGIGGPAVLAGPTGGYLIGFMAAAFVMGLVASRVRTTSGRFSPVRHTAALAAGAVTAEIALYAFGVPWLALYTGGLGQALTAGFIPFLLGDALKTAVAIGAIRGGTKLLSRWGLLPF